MASIPQEDFRGASRLVHIGAAWHFLAISEEHSMRHIIHEASNDGNYAAVADNLINHARWPLRWLISKCSSGGKVPSRCDENLYSAALQLSDLALSYGSFAAAFSCATWGLVTLDLVGSRIKSSGPMISDVRFEAYDRLLGLTQIGDPPFLRTHSVSPAILSPGTLHPI